MSNDDDMPELPVAEEDLVFPGEMSRYSRSNIKQSQRENPSRRSSAIRISKQNSQLSHQKKVHYEQRAPAQHIIYDPDYGSEDSEEPMPLQNQGSSPIHSD